MAPRLKPRSSPSHRSLVVIGLLLLCAPARAATVTYRTGEQGYDGAQEVAISNQNARWNGGQGATDREGPLGCYKVPGDPGYEVRVLLYFGKLNLPRGAHVTAAALTLTFDTWAKDANLRGEYLLTTWDPLSRKLGWTQRDDTHRWAEPGAGKGGKDVLAGPSFTLSSFSAHGEEEKTVPLDPARVAAWLKDDKAPQGLLLRMEAPDQVLRIFSSKDKNIGKRPRLSITYGGSSDTTATAGKPATPEAPGLPAAPLTQTAGRPRLLLGPEVLGALLRRAQKGDGAWQALRARCDGYLPGRVEWPEGNDYPGADSIGEGYQGSGYFEGLMNLGLCYQIGRRLDPAHARAYGQKGAEVLMKMSEPQGPHAVEPLRDSGYGIRFFGVGMALGYDWLYDALSAAERTRLITALHRWVSTYEQKGFGRDHPQGNYFAGYYAAKALFALAVRGDDPQAQAQWTDWLDRVHLGMVQPYYAAHLRGGGWPEGWNYGPTATLNMALPILAARTAQGLDLLHDPRAPFPFPAEQGLHLIHFTWPSRRTLDDRNVQYSGDNPSSAQPFLFTTQAGLLQLLSDPNAPVFHSFARAVRAVQTDKAQPWQEVLFWDEGAKETDFHTLPLSFSAPGMNTAAMRSSWETDAVWAAFTSGPYVNNPDSGEQYFDQGSLAIVRGSRQLLVNAPAALQRHTPGTSDGDRYDDLIYADLFQKGSRTLFNIFYVDAPAPYGQGAYASGESRTHLQRFEDGGDYVYLRGENLEDMYRRAKRARPLTSWTREVVYLRPQLFVVHDRTEIADAGRDQWLAFHLSQQPIYLPPPQNGAHRLDVGRGAAYAGTVTTLLPAGQTTSLVDLFQRHKIFRLEVRPHAHGERQRWLTVFDAPMARGAAAQTIRLSAADGNVQQGEAVGTYLKTPEAGQAVLFVADAAEVGYTVPAAPATHLLIGVQPGTDYSVRIERSGGGHSVRVKKGPGMHSSASGVLRFRVQQDGTLQR